MPLLPGQTNVYTLPGSPAQDLHPPALSSGLPQLREYQFTAVQNVRRAFREGHRRVVLTSPTGSGKTVIFCYLALATVSRGRCVTILAHRQEIRDQISDCLDTFGVPHGIIAPGYAMTDAAVQVGMVQTVGRRLALLAEPDLIIADEAHHTVAGSWRKIVAAWPDAYVLGVTATPERLDGRGLRDVYGQLVTGPSVETLIAEGWLADFDYYAPDTNLDLTKVRRSMGDYELHDLAAAMDKPSITGSAINEYRAHLPGRSALVFCVSIAHAEHVAAQFRAAGFRATSVDGGLDKEERRDRIRAIGNGGLDILTSCEIISEGLDVPGVAGAILLRPTKSLTVFLQQCGRALRPKADGKAVILDHVKNWREHGLPSDPRHWTLDGHAKEASPAPRYCNACDRIFPPNRKITEAECDAQPCPLRYVETPRDIRNRDPNERLAKVDRSTAWAGGLDLVTATGRDWFRLLERADTEDRLRQIARARGFKRGWVWHRMIEREQARREREAKRKEP